MDDNIQYKLRVSEHEKTREWYKWFIDYYVPYNNVVPSRYRKMKRVYEFLNNDITGFEEEIEHICRTQYGDVLSMPEDFESNFVMYNRVYSKASYLVGEMLKRAEDYEVIALSDKAQHDIEKEYNQLLEDALNAAIDAMIRGQESALPDPASLQPSSFQSRYQLFLSRVIRYFKYKFDTQQLKQLAFWHVIAADTALLGIIEEGGKPVPHLFNPLTSGWHVSPDRIPVEKGDYFWNKTAVTVGQALDEIGEDISDEDLDKLISFSNTRYGAKKSHAPGGKAELSHFTYDILSSNQDTHDKTIGQGTSKATARRYDVNRLIWKTYFQFKAYRKVIFLTTNDEYGKEYTTVVPDNFEIPSTAEKKKVKNRYNRKNVRYTWTENGDSYYADILWIPRRYEVTRYGSEYLHNFREMPNQPISLEDPFGSFELSVKGRHFSSINTEPISLAERAINTNLQYILAKSLQSREMSKYEGVIKDVDASLIPDDIHLDDEGQPLWAGADKISVHALLVRILGKNYYNGSQNSGGLINHNKSPGTRVSQSGYFQEIINIQQFCELLDREIGLQMMVPPQAEAIISPSSNASDNQMALQQGYTMAEGYFTMFERVFRKLISEYLRQFQQYYRNFFRENPGTKQVSLYYISTEGQREVLQVTPDIIDFEDMGIFLTDSSFAERYRRYMENVGVALAQNQAENAELYSNIFKSLARGDSPERIHSKIQEIAKRQEMKQAEMQQQVQEGNQQVEMLRLEGQEREQANEIAKIDRKGQWNIAEKAVSEDSDEIPQELEIQGKLQDMDIKEREQQRKERESLESKQKNE
jgi:hypothetical protein